MRAASPPYLFLLIINRLLVTSIRQPAERGLEHQRSTGSICSKPVPRPSGEINGLAKIVQVFEGRFLAVALVSDARAGAGLCVGAACIACGNRPVENRQFSRSLDFWLPFHQGKGRDGNEKLIFFHQQPIAFSNYLYSH